jgi:flagellar motility protein MotE (MotC chaperone)
LTKYGPVRKLQSEYLLDLEDAVVAVKDEKGKVKLHQAVNLTAAGAVSGGSRQFDPVCPGQRSHAGQGARRAERDRRQGLEKRLLDARAALEAAPQQAKQDMERRTTEARASLEARRHKVEAVRQRATRDLHRVFREKAIAVGRR